jgi:pimeloyl-ACP methyl ester carboxylesterase
LDWGGAGRPLVLLTGSGLTAHIYDEFAPNLTDCCHVYALTRRGFGASSHPDSGYDDQQLADDVLAVVEQLDLVKPVLVGHSMAGGELTTLGSQHSDRLGGLVYVEALDDPRDNMSADPEWMRLLQRLPAGLQGPPPPPPDYSSFSAYRAQQSRNNQGAFPESELRQLFEANPDGSMGRYRASTDVINTAIGAGQKRRDYSRIRVPVLAVRGQVPRSVDEELRARGYQPRSAEERADIEAFNRATATYFDRWVSNLKSAVPSTRVVDLPDGGHYVFLTKEREVLRAILTFVAQLR